MGRLHADAGHRRLGIVFSIPLGILLALGTAIVPAVVHLLWVLFIEFVRGVPLITILFMANVMLPLFLPQGVTSTCCCAS